MRPCSLALTLFVCSACTITPRAPLGPRTEPSIAVDPVRFETSEGTRLAFDLSPDGQTIVFDLLGQLWLLPASGGEAHPLTDAVRDTAEDLNPAFSPDGKWIAFQSDRPSGRALWVIPAEGGAPRSLSRRRIGYFINASPAWSPDGREVVYTAGPGLVRADVAGGEERVMAIDTLRPPDGVAWYEPRPSYPAWAPDGEHLAFVNVQAGGGVWETAADGRGLRRLTPEGVSALGPSYSPDGRHIAFFARDDARRYQLWVQALDGTPARMLTEQEEVVPLRARWYPDGRTLLYSAEGGLWRIPITGGTPESIPFRAHIHVDRQRPDPRAVRFPTLGSERVARGFSALALSPDGERIALIALDSLWIWRPGSAARAITAAPPTVDGLTWSPDGREVAWSHSTIGDSTSLFAADVESGAVRSIARLPGASRSAMPLWSPDGQWIAFEHGGRLRLADPKTGRPASLKQTRDLGEVNLGWGTLAWSPRSEALVAAHLPIQDLGSDSSVAFWIPLEGERRRVERFPTVPAHLHLYEDGRAVWVENNLLWEASFDGSAGLRSDPVPLSPDAAVEARYGREGSILYLSSDGLRIRRPDGTVRRLEWPLRYRVRAAPEPLLVRAVRIIDGTGSPPSEPRDLLVEGGRIARTAPAGTLNPPAGARIVEGGGRTVIPGLIDLHAHIWTGPTVPGWLVNGVTTVRDIASQRLHTADLRNTLEAGIREGPRVVFAGGMFHGGRGYSTLTDQMVSDADAVDRGMAIMEGMGAAYIKWRGMSDWWGGVNVVRAAHRFGVPVSGHCSDPLPIVAAGMDGREHTTDCFRDRGLLPRADLVSLHREAGIWVVPTVGILAPPLTLADEPSLLHAPNVAPFLHEKFRSYYAEPLPDATRASLTAVTRRMGRAALRYHEAGVVLGAGSDHPLPLSVHLEMERLVASGLPPLEAIKAATGSAAAILNAPEIGIIEEGRWADLVILDADPLEDIRNTRRIWRIIQGGRVIDRSALVERSRR